MFTLTTLARLLKEEDGATAIEYGLIAANFSLFSSPKFPVPSPRCGARSYDFDSLDARAC